MTRSLCGANSVGSPESVFRFLIDARLMTHWIGILHSLDAQHDSEPTPENLMETAFIEELEATTEMALGEPDAQDTASSTPCPAETNSHAQSSSGS